MCHGTFLAAATAVSTAARAGPTLPWPRPPSTLGGHGRMEFNLADVNDAVSAAIGDRECVVWRDRRLTYAQVAERTNRLANHLVRGGAGCPRRAELAGRPRERTGPPGVLPPQRQRVPRGDAGRLQGPGRALQRQLPLRRRGAPLPARRRRARGDRVPQRVRRSAGRGPTRPPRPRGPAAGRRRQRCRSAPGRASGTRRRWPPPVPTAPPVERTPRRPLHPLHRRHHRHAQGRALAAGRHLRRRHGRPEPRRPARSGPASTRSRRAAVNGGARLLPAPPFMHGAGHWLAFNAFTGGSTICLQDDTVASTPDDVWRTIEREQVNILLIVGDAFARPLVDELERQAATDQPYDLSSLLMVISGGAPLNSTLKERLLAQLPTVMVMDGVGASETGSQMAHMSAAGQAASTGTFTPGPGAAIVSDDLTAVLEAGHAEVGLARPGGAGAARLPRRCRQDGAHVSPSSTGCATRCPATGPGSRPTGSSSCYGRDSVTINSGGEKIFAEEVEQAIAHHPDVYDVVCAGRPSERWGQEVVAVVQLRDGAATDRGRASWRRPPATSPATSSPRRSSSATPIVRSPAGKADYRWARAQVGDDARNSLDGAGRLGRMPASTDARCLSDERRTHIADRFRRPPSLTGAPVAPAAPDAPVAATPPQPPGRARRACPHVFPKEVNDVRLTLTRPRPDLRPRLPPHPTAGGAGPRPGSCEPPARPASRCDPTTRPPRAGRGALRLQSSSRSRARRTSRAGAFIPPWGTITSAWRFEGSMNCSWAGRTVVRYCSITLAVERSTLGDIALEPADEAHVGIGVDEHPQVEPLAELGLVEHEDALHHDDTGRRDLDVAPGAAGRWRSRTRAPAPAGPRPARPRGRGAAASRTRRGGRS